MGIIYHSSCVQIQYVLPWELLCTGPCFCLHDAGVAPGDESGWWLLVSREFTPPVACARHRPRLQRVFAFLGRSRSVPEVPVHRSLSSGVAGGGAIADLSTLLMLFARDLLNHYVRLILCFSSLPLPKSLSVVDRFVLTSIARNWSAQSREALSAVAAQREMGSERKTLLLSARMSERVDPYVNVASSTPTCDTNCEHSAAPKHNESAATASGSRRTRAVTAAEQLSQPHPEAESRAHALVSRSDSAAAAGDRYANR